MTYFSFHFNEIILNDFTAVLNLLTNIKGVKKECVLLVDYYAIRFIISCHGNTAFVTWLRFSHLALLSHHLTVMDESTMISNIYTTLY